MDLDRRLVVGGGREDLGLAGRDRRVPLDQLRRHAAQRLDPERQRGHVQQQHVLHVAGQHAALDRRAHRHDLVRVDALVRLAVEELRDHLLHLRDPGRSADQDHLVDVGGLEAGILQRLLARPDRPLDQVVDQLLELRAGQA